jgi:HSP20 family molecular chaperone IbpA
MSEQIDATNISAKYADGVLQVSLHVINFTENAKREIVIN